MPEKRQPENEGALPLEGDNPPLGIVLPQGKLFDGETEIEIAFEEAEVPDGCTEDDLVIQFFQTGKFGDSKDGCLRPGWVLLDSELDERNRRGLQDLLDREVRLFLSKPGPGHQAPSPVEKGSDA